MILIQFCLFDIITYFLIGNNKVPWMIKTHITHTYTQTHKPRRTKIQLRYIKKQGQPETLKKQLKADLKPKYRAV